MDCSPGARGLPAGKQARYNSLPMRIDVLALLAIFGAGCLDELPPEDPHTPVEQRTRCSALEGMTFRSAEQGECGLTPNGVAYCTWGITFEALDATTTAFTWRHSDVGESGAVTCDGGLIHGEAHGLVYEGMFDEASLDLVWDSRAYLAAP